MANVGSFSMGQIRVIEHALALQSMALLDIEKTYYTEPNESDVYKKLLDMAQTNQLTPELAQGLAQILGVVLTQQAQGEQ